ncbi:hypothetical protein TI04_01305 [Achromatium sp. WMS2]|nr:hypothetical protein TI04_01305 [Achromatium sp. WMS2]
MDQFDVIKFISSALLLLIFINFTKMDDSALGLFSSICVNLVLIPSLVIYSGKSLPNDFIIVTYIAMLIVVILPQYLVIPRIAAAKINVSSYIRIMLVLTLSVIMGIILFGGLRFINFDFSRVYDFRREAADSIPGIFGYLNPIATKVFIPFGLVAALIRKQIIFMCIFILMSVIFFRSYLP